MAGRQEKKLHVNEAMLCARDFHMLSPHLVTHLKGKAVSKIKEKIKAQKYLKSVEPVSDKVRIQDPYVLILRCPTSSSLGTNGANTRRKGCREVRGPTQWKMRGQNPPSTSLKKYLFIQLLLGFSGSSGDLCWGTSLLSSCGSGPSSRGGWS